MGGVNRQEFAKPGLRCPREGQPTGWVRRAIERALQRGPEAELHAAVVLHVENGRILEELRRNRTTARYLGESLGTKAVAVRRRDWEALCAAAARLGLLIEPPHETP